MGIDYTILCTQEDVGYFQNKKLKSKHKTPTWTTRTNALAVNKCVITIIHNKG